jgi:hypothetical protein
MKLILAVLLLSTVPALGATPTITGIPRIVDGDTVLIDETKIRLSGIDAPETDQVCLDPAGERWPCGVTTSDELIEHVGVAPGPAISAATIDMGEPLGLVTPLARTSRHGWCGTVGRCHSSDIPTSMMGMKKSPDPHIPASGLVLS